MDIGFVKEGSGTIGATLGLSLAVADGDGDTTADQTLSLQISNDYIM